MKLFLLQNDISHIYISWIIKLYLCNIVAYKYLFLERFNVYVTVSYLSAERQKLSTHTHKQRDAEFASQSSTPHLISMNCPIINTKSAWQWWKIKTCASESKRVQSDDTNAHMREATAKHFGFTPSAKYCAERASKKKSDTLCCPRLSLVCVRPTVRPQAPKETSKLTFNQNKLCEGGAMR